MRNTPVYLLTLRLNRGYTGKCKIKPWFSQGKTMTNSLSITQVDYNSLVEKSKRGDDWINATLWCSHFGCQWAQIAKQPEFKKYLKALQDKGHGHGDILSLSKKVRKGKTWETWVHPLVAIKLAEKLSPEFEVYVKETFKRFLESDITLADEVIQGNNNLEDLKWITARSQGKLKRLQLTDTLKAYGLTMGYQYGNCTNAIYKAILGGTKKEIAEQRGLKKKDNLRDNMSVLEITMVDFSETLAEHKIKERNLQGYKPCLEACTNAGEIVANSVKAYLEG